MTRPPSALWEKWMLTTSETEKRSSGETRVNQCVFLSGLAFLVHPNTFIPMSAARRTISAPRGLILPRDLPWGSIPWRRAGSHVSGEGEDDPPSYIPPRRWRCIPACT
jgi:hypothetical protein